MDIATEPNRELDGFIAEHLQGYHVEHVGPDAKGEHGGTEILVPPGQQLRDMESWVIPGRGPIPRMFFVRSYSRSFQDAWELFLWMKWRGSHISLNFGEDTGGWECRWVTGGVGITATAYTPEMAICRCAADAARLRRDAA